MGFNRGCGCAVVKVFGCGTFNGDFCCGHGKEIHLQKIQLQVLIMRIVLFINTFLFKEIAPDFKRPDRLWCFDELGRYSVINAVNGKFECEWKSIALEGKRVLFSVFNDQVLMAHETSDSLNQILSGYTMNSQTTELEKSFDFDLKEDLLKDLEANSTFTIKQICIHSERIGLFGVLLQMKDCSGTRVLIVQVSPDHWKPESGWLDEFEGCQGAFGDELCWGPVEEDPITREIGSKLLLLSKEDKTIQLYTVHTNTQGTPVN